MSFEMLRCEPLADDYRHLVSIPPGPHLLSDAIISSPILFDPEMARGMGGGEGGGDGLLGDLENTDPELAMVSCHVFHLLIWTNLTL